MREGRDDDVLVGAVVAAIALLCLLPRYLPMVDLPQHHAMVSIFVHHADPEYGFAERYTFDLLGRPYATVYLLGAGLAFVLPLRVAMALVVALVTVAPLVGAWALLRATGRPRSWALLAAPFAFGGIWHWGFLNFLLGTGLLLVCLALVVREAQSPRRARALALGALALVLLFTHVHGVFMLLALAPPLAWGYARSGPLWRGVVRAVAPLVPAAAAMASFVLTTWAQAEGSPPPLDPGLGERLRQFPEVLAGGMRDPWPVASVLALAAAIALAIALGIRGPAGPAWGRDLAARAACLAGQVVLYLALPLNTSTAAFVSARHALLILIFALPLLPALAGRARHVGRGAAALFALVGLVLAAKHLACFDREARDFDRILSVMKPNRRVAPLIFDASGACVAPTTFPYVHFDAYYQAQRGGDLARSFAVVWNIPVRYRADYQRHVVAEAVEWSPHLFSAERDLPHFDYLLVRRDQPFRLPPELGLVTVARMGPWTLLENPNALPSGTR